MLAEVEHNKPLIDYSTKNEVRWCPGCGDYAILKAIKVALENSGLNNEEVVFISGIGCSGRFPYYLNTHGFHTIHGRAIPIATGLKLARPDLTVFVITGDGDSMSIGLSHVLHMIRRDIDLNVLLINNQVYGLTKGQVSPTTPSDVQVKNNNTIEQKSFDPLALANAAGCQFLGRAVDVDQSGIVELITDSLQHKGCSITEIYQNCHIFNDGAFDAVRNKAKDTPSKMWLDQETYQQMHQQHCADEIIRMRMPTMFGRLV